MSLSVTMFEAMLNTSVDVRRPTVTQDKIGGEAANYASVRLGLAARIEPLSGREHALRGGTAVECSHTMFCLPADITERDQIIERLKHPGRTYEVTHVGGDSEGHHMEIDLLEIRFGGSA